MSNQKARNRRKAHKNKILKDYKDNLANELKKIDPQTCEGQSRLNIDVITNISTTSSTSSVTDPLTDFDSIEIIETQIAVTERPSLYSRFRNFFGF